jgi:CyaY protein
MNEAMFLTLAEQTLTELEDAIDDSNGPLDYENNGSVMTIDCEDSDSQVIVSRQLAMHQLWVAAKSGGYHCDWQNEQWFCKTTGETLKQLLDRVLSEQSDDSLCLPWSGGGQPS